MICCWPIRPDTHEYRTQMADPTASVRVRFAPSPTGLLHVGGLRTALYNFLYARKHDGTFVLRLEDTDRDRYVPEAEEDIVRALEWTGLEWDEGPWSGGPYGPYVQSERADRYEEFAEQLVERDRAYYAFDTREELETMRARLRTPENPSPQYDAATRMEMTNSLTLSENEVAERLDRGDPYTVRLKVPRDETIRFEDEVRGWVSFESSKLDDQVLLKSDGMPTYHLANVVDDHQMEITHVIRGEEWLSSTPKHVLLYRYLGWEMPRTAHLPLILSPSGGKLSKRDADEEGIPVFVRDYREQGYEPEALINFLAFLGWNPGDEREIFSLRELIDAFSLDRVGSSGVQFDLDKLEWYNENYVRAMSPEQLARKARGHLEERGFSADGEYVEAVAELMQDRIGFAHELASSGAFFFEAPDEFDPDGVDRRWKRESADLLRDYADRLEDPGENASADRMEEILRQLADERDVSAGAIIHPARLAITGRHYGPSLFHLMEVLGPNECAERMRAAIEPLNEAAGYA